MTAITRAAYEAQFIKVQAYSIAEGHPSWIFRCPHCGKLHTHGAAEGSRVTHCTLARRSRLPDPWLVYAGPAPEEMLIEVYGKRWRKAVADEVAQFARFERILAAVKLERQLATAGQ